MNETLSSEDNPESVTHVLRQFCYLSLRLLNERGSLSAHHEIVWSVSRLASSHDSDCRWDTGQRHDICGRDYRFSNRRGSVSA